MILDKRLCFLFSWFLFLLFDVEARVETKCKSKINKTGEEVKTSIHPFFLIRTSKFHLRLEK